MSKAIITKTEMTLYEQVHPEHMQTIMNHPYVWPGQKAMYEKMHTKFLNSKGGKIVTHYKRKAYGRFYVQDRACVGY